MKIRILYTVVLLVLGLTGHGQQSVNYTKSKSYYLDGTEASLTKVFSDKMGRTLQQSNRIYSAGNTLAYQIQYDGFGRPYVQSLVAPTNQSGDPSYVNSFLSYSTVDMEGNEVPPSGTSSSIANNSTPGTVGWYYSQNNTAEPYVNQTNYPFSQVHYYDHPSTSVKHSAGAGNGLYMGSTHEIESGMIEKRTAPEIPAQMIPEIERKSFQYTPEFLVQQSTDADGHLVTTYSGKYMTASVTGENPSNYSDAGTLWSFQYFDERGNLLLDVPPEGWIENFTPSDHTTNTSGNLNWGNYASGTTDFTVTAISTPAATLKQTVVANIPKPYFEFPDGVDIGTCLPNSGIYWGYNGGGNANGGYNGSAISQKMNVTGEEGHTTISVLTIDESNPPGTTGNATNYAQNKDVLIVREAEDYAIKYTAKLVGIDGSSQEVILATKPVYTFIRKNQCEWFDYTIYSDEDVFLDSAALSDFIQLKWRISDVVFADQYDPSVPFEDHTQYGIIAQVGEPAPTAYVTEVRNMFDNAQSSAEPFIKFYSTIKVRQKSRFATAIVYNLVDQYVYDDQDRLVSSYRPDEGWAHSVYNDLGQTRFTQDAQQAVSGAFNYFVYDDLGRVIEHGVYDANLSGSGDAVIFESFTANQERTITLPSTGVFDIVNQENGLDASRCVDVVSNHFDTPITLPSGISSSYQHGLTRAQLVKTSGPNVTTYYGYDYYGRLTWTIQEYPQLGTKTIDYVYNAKGQLEQTIYQRDLASERFYHRYQYDADGRLILVETSKDGVGQWQLQQQYEYYLHGPLKRVVSGNNLQGDDLIYTTEGYLKAINDPSLSTAYDPGQDDPNQNTVFADVFGMTLDYYNGDYSRSGTNVFSTQGSLPAANYSGLIAQQNWQMGTNGLLAQYEGTPLAYRYTYNDLNQLTNATFGTQVVATANSHTFTSSTDYALSNLAYDKNGNVSTLTRKGYSTAGLAMDNLSYTYPTRADGKKTGNRLLHVDDSDASGYTDDIKDQSDVNNYLYDNTGRLVSNKQEDIDMEYNYLGLVSAIKERSTGNIIVSFAYDNGGQRFSKTAYSSNGLSRTTTYYVTDASGMTMATYAQTDDYSGGQWIAGNVSLVNWYIYGSNRIGVYDKVDDQTQYEVTDHLGNIRLVYANDPSIVNSTDFEDGTMGIWQPRENANNFTYSGGRLHVNADNNSEGIRRQLAVVQGERYTVKFDVELTQASYVRCVVINAANTSEKPVFIDYDTDGTKTATFVAPSTAVNIHFFQPGYAKAPGNHFYLDNVYLAKDELVIVQATDYYPFGSPMPGRQYTGGQGDHGYGYQGAFAYADPETNLNLFDLRSYDSRLGRWLSPDPKNQFYSSFVGMGNNPANMIDPDGAWGYLNLSTGVYYWFDNLQIGGDFESNDNWELVSTSWHHFRSILMDVGIESYQEGNYAAWEHGWISKLKLDYGEFNKLKNGDLAYDQHSNVSKLDYVSFEPYFDYDGDGKIAGWETLIGTVDVLSTIVDILDVPSGESAIFHAGLKAAFRKGGKEAAEEVGEQALKKGDKLADDVVEKVDEIVEAAEEVSKLIPKNISLGKQGKHILGHNNYQAGKSILSSNSQTLLDGFHAGKFKTLRTFDNRVIVDFGSDIGTYFNKAGNAVGPTRFGTIHYGKSGAHIVPANPVQF